MSAAEQKQAVAAYVEAYNRFDVDAMLVHLHEDVEFRNRSNGEVNLTTWGKPGFRQQAEQAKHYFSAREQRITEWNVAGDQVEISIEYTAVVVVEMPNGLRPGDPLRLHGRSIFRFLDGQIISIEDIS